MFFLSKSLLQLCYRDSWSTHLAEDEWTLQSPISISLHDVRCSGGWTICTLLLSTYQQCCARCSRPAGPWISNGAVHLCALLLCAELVLPHHLRGQIGRSGDAELGSNVQECAAGELEVFDVSRLSQLQLCAADAACVRQQYYRILLGDLFGW